MIVRGLIVIWMLGWCGWLVGQGDDVSVSPAGKVIETYKKGDYLKAINDFKELLSRYPKDPLYHYYLGSSLVVSKVDLLQGIELLKYAVSRSEINEANYFLGMAYYRLYDFNRAMEYYQSFKEGASLGQLKEFSVYREMQRIKYVQPLLTVVTVPVVVDKKTAGDSSALCEEVKKWTGYCFPEWPLPAEMQIVPGEYFYYASMSPYKVRKKDLYRVKKLPAGWGTPENLGSAVNSAEDDINPFYVPEEQVLYFASKGNEGYGGYDIFITRYDSVKKTWSKPENLPFPLNSPYDEIAYFFDKTSGLALLVSNRENDYKTYTLYFLDPKAIHHIKEITAPADLLQESRLEINAAEATRIRFERYRSTMEGKETRSKEMVKEDNKDISSDKMTAEYVSLVSEALQYQIKSDSLSFVADRLRGLTTVIADPVERGKVQKEIIQLEAQAKTLQEKADKLYLEVREKELGQDAHNRSLYKKTETSSAKDTASGKLPEEYTFEILPLPAYSEKNPIPMDVPYPAGVLYKIQLGVFSKPVPSGQFNGLKPVTGERLNEGNVIKYYAGWFTSYEEAEKALRKVQEYGYKQAFIVAYYNGEKLPVNRARQLEEE